MVTLTTFINTVFLASVVISSVMAKEVPVGWRSTLEDNVNDLFSPPGESFWSNYQTALNYFKETVGGDDNLPVDTVGEDDNLLVDAVVKQTVDNRIAKTESGYSNETDEPVEYLLQEVEDGDHEIIALESISDPVEYDEPSLPEEKDNFNTTYDADLSLEQLNLEGNLSNDYHIAEENKPLPELKPLHEPEPTEDSSDFSPAVDNVMVDAIVASVLDIQDRFDTSVETIDTNENPSSLIPLNDIKTLNEIEDEKPSSLIPLNNIKTLNEIEDEKPSSLIPLNDIKTLNEIEDETTTTTTTTTAVTTEIPSIINIKHDIQPSVTVITTTSQAETSNSDSAPLGTVVNSVPNYYALGIVDMITTMGIYSGVLALPFLIPVAFFGKKRKRRSVNVIQEKINEINKVDFERDYKL